MICVGGPYHGKRVVVRGNFLRVVESQPKRNWPTYVGYSYNDDYESQVKYSTYTKDEIHGISYLRHESVALDSDLLAVLLLEFVRSTK